MDKRTSNQFRAFLAAPLKGVAGLTLRQLMVHAITLAFMLLTFSLMLNFINQVIQSSALEARKAQLAEEAARIASENRHLQGSVDYALSDAYVEQAAREQLGWAREGETVLLPQFPAIEPESKPAPEAIPMPVRPTEPNWQRWWDALQPKQT